LAFCNDTENRTALEKGLREIDLGKALV